MLLGKNEIAGARRRPQNEKQTEVLDQQGKGALNHRVWWRMRRYVQDKRLRAENGPQVWTTRTGKCVFQFGQSRHTHLVLSLKVLYRIRVTGLAARIRFLRPMALAFGATVLRGLVRKNQRDAVASTQNEDSGNDQRRNDASDPHSLTLSSHLLICQRSHASSSSPPHTRGNVLQARDRSIQGATRHLGSLLFFCTALSSLPVSRFIPALCPTPSINHIINHRVTLSTFPFSSYS